MGLSAKQIAAKAESLRSRAASKNKYMDEILALREGRWEEVFPDMLPEGFSRPFVANMIDIAAKDTSEMIAPLPKFSCTVANMGSDRARSFADKKTKIANYIIDCSNLQIQMYSAADRLLTYGYVAFLVEPDDVRQMPKILADNTFRAYYENSPYGDETYCYFRMFRKHASQLAAQFPEKAEQILQCRHKDRYGTFEDTELEVIRWWDKDQQLLLIKENAIILSKVDNQLGRCPIRVVEMPHIGDCVRGQYDDAIGVQAARTQAQTYLLQAMDESVNAPLAVPNDVQELALGPKAVVHTDTPQNLRRIDLNIPAGVFAEAQNLTAENRMATRYPEGRSGQSPGSIVTGEGVEALMGTFSTQIKTAQTVLQRGLEDVASIALEMDEKRYGNIVKTIRGKDAGSPYEITYTPSKDIKGDYTVEAAYGSTAGLDPNRALIFLLQVQAAGGISRDRLMRELPIALDVEDEKRRIDTEMLRDSLTQAIAGYAQAIPMMATNGMDPAQPVAQIAEIIRLREKGQSQEEAVAKVFAPPPPPPEAEAAPGAAGAEGDPTAGLFDEQTGLPPGIAEGQAQNGAGGAPDLQMLLAGLTPGGKPNLQANVSKRIPAA